MPLELVDNYKPAWPIRGPHRQTMLANLLRSPTAPVAARERVETEDGDFVDLDWYRQGSRKCIFVSHGLEGSSRRQYVLGLIAPMYEAGWDAVGFNFRGCSGEPNRLARSYHCGDTGDLNNLLQRIVASKQYDTIVLAGFSLGGNVSLLLAGQAGRNLPAEVKAVVGVSVPLDMTSSVPQIEHRRNWHYLLAFLKSLKAKAMHKMELGILESSYAAAVRAANNFSVFDEVYTAPLHGFASAEDYWAKVSTLPVIEDIAVPSLIINSEDDTFLSEKCFPKGMAKDHKLIHLSVTKYGGHVGFIDRFPWKSLWSEARIRSFLLDELSL